VNYRLSWFLRRHADEPRTLDDIGTAVGLTAGQVSRELDRLRARGFQVDAHPATGLHVRAVPQGYDRDEVAFARSARRIGHTIRVYDATGSTNDVAMRLAAAGRQTDGLVVVADEQTAGRGRQGAAWFASRGESLLMSIVHWAEPRADRIAETVLAAGVGVADAVAVATGLRVGIKWPNDVEVGRRKVAGVLVEGGGRGCEPTDGPPAEAPYVVGIGVNVNQAEGEFPSEIAGQASSLRMGCGRQIDRILLLDLILEALEATLGRLDGGDIEFLRKQYMVHCDMVGRDIRATEGGETFCGSVDAISPHYALVVRLENGTLRSFDASSVRVEDLNDRR